MNNSINKFPCCVQENKNSIDYNSSHVCLNVNQPLSIAYRATPNQQSYLFQPSYSSSSVISTNTVTSMCLSPAKKSHQSDSATAFQSIKSIPTAIVKACEESNFYSSPHLVSVLSNQSSIQLINSFEKINLSSTPPKKTKSRPKKYFQKYMTLSQIQEAKQKGKVIEVLEQVTFY